MAAKKVRRRGGRVVSREIVQNLDAVLQVGEPRPTARAVSRFQIQQLAVAAARTWTSPRNTFTVSLFARWPWEEPEPEGGYGGFTPLKQEEAYGHPLSTVSRDRHYYGWRSRVVSRGFFVETPNIVVRGIIEGYGGRTPIRCISVRQYS